jgi:tetratricopeptide (TPR) repeat protein
MKMDIDNPVMQLCILGTQAEYQGRIEAARECYRKAWEAAGDDFEACVAAHYLARHQADPAEELHWNRIALEKVVACADARVQDFFPSLYLNMGRSHELLGNDTEAQRYYDLAASRGFPHRTEDE